MRLHKLGVRKTHLAILIFRCTKIQDTVTGRNVLEAFSDRIHLTSTHMADKNWKQALWITSSKLKRGSVANSRYLFLALVVAQSLLLHTHGGSIPGLIKLGIRHIYLK
jgi:hypothetical protein